MRTCPPSKSSYKPCCRSELTSKDPSLLHQPWSLLGAGVTGIALAQAGASVTLTDLPHICPLTRENVEANCEASSTHAQVCSPSCCTLLSTMACHLTASSGTWAGMQHLKLARWGVSLSCFRASGQVQSGVRMFADVEQNAEAVSSPSIPSVHECICMLLDRRMQRRSATFTRHPTDMLRASLLACRIIEAWTALEGRRAGHVSTA